MTPEQRRHFIVLVKLAGPGKALLWLTESGVDDTVLKKYNNLEPQTHLTLHNLQRFITDDKFSLYSQRFMCHCVISNETEKEKLIDAFRTNPHA